MSHPFALITASLIFLPTPSSANVESYRTLFRKLHADATFCYVAFGDDFGPFVWSDDEVKELLLNRDAALRWGRRGMGDFALGLLPQESIFESLQGRCLKGTDEKVKIIEGSEYTKLEEMDDGNFLENIEWVGYTCVRDASTSSVEELYADPPASVTLPPWQEMIEMRYGLDDKYRGRGYATTTARIVMQWAVEEHGVRRFIASTQKANTKSGSVLSRLGFRKTDTTYFQDDGLDEWECVATAMEE